MSAILFLLLFILVFTFVFKNIPPYNFDSTDVQKENDPAQPAQILHPQHYVPKRILTRVEEDFFRKLLKLLQDEYYVFPQVLVSSIATVAPTIKFADTYTYRNKINRKTIDFVVFRKADLIPLLAIELDDFTHRFQKRILRDMFIDETLKSINLKILHIGDFTLNEVDRKRIREILPAKKSEEKLVSQVDAGSLLKANFNRNT